MIKSVSDYLKDIDYKSLSSYKPSNETLEYINFIHMVNGDSLENKTPPVHLVALDSVFYNSNPSAVMCHRGFAKTSLFAEMLILYVAAFGKLPMKDFGKVNFIIYVGDSVENGVKSLRKNIEYRYESSEFLRKLIPNVSIKATDENGADGDFVAGRKFTDIRLEFANFRGDRLVVRLYGAKSGIRGAKELGVRPQVAIIDDILSDDDARSDTILAGIEDTIHKGVKYALNPKRQKIIWLGTPFTSKDPLYKAVESGAYNVACFPVCEKFPCSKEEFKGSWEDRFDYNYVKRAYDEAVSLKKPQSFYQELMLQIISQEDKLVKDGDIIWFSKSKVLKNRSNYNFYITTDLATSTKNSADYSVISVWAVNHNEDYLLVDGICKKCLVDEFIKELFRLVQIYRPLSVGVEVTGQQGGFVRWITNEMISNNCWFNLASSNNNGEYGIRPIKDKFSRFSTFLPKIKHKKLWVCDEMRDTAWGQEFKEEIDKASLQGFKSKHDDILDTISMLDSMSIYLPSKEESYSSPFYEEGEGKKCNTLF